MINNFQASLLSILIKTDEEHNFLQLTNQGVIPIERVTMNEVNAVKCNEGLIKSRKLMLFDAQSLFGFFEKLLEFFHCSLSLRL
jgi:hypothetical protein